MVKPNSGTEQREWTGFSLNNLYTLDTTLETFQYLNRKRKGKGEKVDGFFAKMGTSGSIPKTLRFMQEEQDYYNGYKRFQLSVPEHEPLEWYKKIVDYAYEQHIRLFVYFNPLHARLSLMIDKAGQQETLNHLKRQIIDYNEAIAKKHGRAPMGLWDFSDYNHITTA